MFMLPATGRRPRSRSGAALMARLDRLRGPISCRERCFLVLEEPVSSHTARVVSAVVRLVVLTSAIAVTTESIEDVTERTGRMPWLIISDACNALFVCEAVCRVVCYVPMRRAISDTFLWIDVLTVLPFLVRCCAFPSLLPDSSAAAPPWLRVLESFAQVRLLKLCRYYEGADLLARAFSRSLRQLSVPLFLLLIIMVCCSAALYHIELDATALHCRRLWRKQGVPQAFLSAHSAGVGWTCASACAAAAAPSLLPAALNASHDDGAWACATCHGYPHGHPECLGVQWGQTFDNIPHAMWFMLVTVTTVGFGDVYPTSWGGKLYVSLVLLSGVVFLAMPLVPKCMD